MDQYTSGYVHIPIVNNFQMIPENVLKRANFVCSVLSKKHGNILKKPITPYKISALMEESRDILSFQGSSSVIPNVIFSEHEFFAQADTIMNRIQLPNFQKWYNEFGKNISIFYNDLYPEGAGINVIDEMPNGEQNIYVVMSPIYSLWQTLTYIHELTHISYDLNKDKSSLDFVEYSELLPMFIEYLILNQLFPKALATAIFENEQLTVSHTYASDLNEQTNAPCCQDFKCYYQRHKKLLGSLTNLSSLDSANQLIDIYNAGNEGIVLNQIDDALSGKKTLKNMVQDLGIEAKSVQK